MRATMKGKMCYVHCFGNLTVARHALVNYNNLFIDLDHFEHMLYGIVIRCDSSNINATDQAQTLNIMLSKWANLIYV